MIEVHQISWSKVTRDQLRWHPIQKKNKNTSFLFWSLLVCSCYQAFDPDTARTCYVWLANDYPGSPKAWLWWKTWSKALFSPTSDNSGHFNFQTRKRCFLTNKFLNWDLSDNPKKLIIFFYHHPINPLSICIVEERSINHRSSTQITMLLCC